MKNMVLYLLVTFYFIVGGANKYGINASRGIR